MKEGKDGRGLRISGPVRVSPHRDGLESERIARLADIAARASSLGGATLPPGWRDYPAPDAVKDVGTSWATPRRSAALLVPSAVMPEEHDLLLNPEPPDFAPVELGEPSAVAFDARMWKGV